MIIMDKFETSSTLSWILTEILEKEEDFLSIICKDGKEFRTSGLLLAAVSPWINSLMNPADLQECVLHLPDTDIKYIKGIFAKVYSFASDKDHPDSVDWYKDPLQQVIFSQTDENIFQDYDESIFFSKKKSLENGIKGEEYDDQMVFVDFLAVDNIDISETLDNIKYEAIDDLQEGKEFLGKECKVELQRINEEKKFSAERLARMAAGRKRAKRGRQVKEGVERNKMKKLKQFAKKIKKEEEMDSETEDDTSAPSEKKTTLRKKREKVVDSNSDASENESDEFNIDDCNDKDSDEKNSDSSDEEENVPLSRRRKGDTRTKWLQKVTEDDLPKDEKFMKIFKELKQMLEDCTWDEDPWKFLTKKDDSFLVRFNQKHDFKLICPLCMEMFTQDNRKKDFRRHLQKHKFKTFKCSCMPTNEGKEKSFREMKEKERRMKHIRLEHWKWVTCQHCKADMQPESYDRHVNMKHPQFSNSSCELCPEKHFASRSSFSYRIHMAYHKAESSNCGCPIAFENKKHKVHHMQSVHEKDLVCCSKCLFMTSSKYQLNHHDKKVHSEKSTPKREWICDICGLSLTSKGSQQEHIQRKHDPVMLSCPHCPKQGNALYLQEHIKNVHSDSGICNLCGAQVNQLKVHMKNMHTPKHLMKYPCPDCDKVFSYSNLYKKHQMNVHLKLRPYKCRYGCEFAYNDSGNRNAHEKKKHGGLFSSKALDAIKDE